MYPWTLRGNEGEIDFAPQCPVVIPSKDQPATRERQAGPGRGGLPRKPRRSGGGKGPQKTNARSNKGLRVGGEPNPLERSTTQSPQPLSPLGKLPLPPVHSFLSATSGFPCVP